MSKLVAAVLLMGFILVPALIVTVASDVDARPKVHQP